MSIGKIGSHGEQLDEQIFDKVESLRQMWPDGLIQVDGGVDLNNAQSLIDLGATSLAIGSAIWGSGDVLGVIKKFKEL
jgi:ribulose-phosphate 3-epimerase